MADSTINELENLDSVANNDELVLWDTSASGTKKATVSNVVTPVATSVATSAINALDVSSVGGSGKYISAISETNGKISATATSFGSVASGNAYPVTGGSVYSAIGAKTGLLYKTPRWLRFSASNKKSLVIKAGTIILVGSNIYEATSDTTYSMGSSLTAGTEYFVYLNYSSGSWTVTCSTTYSADTTTSRYIGRFHTLCAAVTTNAVDNMLIPASPNSGLVAGGNILVKSYDSNKDSDFYNLYNKTIVSVETGTYYDVVTCQHILAGYSDGDILPESVMCLSFGVNTLHKDATVYDKDTDMFIDVYLQSGTGLNTKSVYNATHTVSRAGICHQEDMRQVGKKLLNDYVFSSAAIGGNECTNITGSSDKGTVGGHVDTADKRMVSAIGCEEMAGYLWQWLDEFPYCNTTSGWQTIDKQNLFGQQYWNTHQLVAGGSWGSGSDCGSRCRGSDYNRPTGHAVIGSRGSSRAVYGVQ